MDDIIEGLAVFIVGMSLFFTFLYMFFVIVISTCFAIMFLHVLFFCEPKALFIKKRKYVEIQRKTLVCLE